jgi:hypothetical protein
VVALFSDSAGTGLSAKGKVAVISLVDTFAQGAARTHNNASLAEERTGVTSEEFWKAQEPVLVGALGSGRFPHVAALAEDAFEMAGEGFFEFWLQRLLDGLEPYVAGGEAGGSPRGVEAGGRGQGRRDVARSRT